MQYRIYFQPGKDTIEHRKIKDLTRKESINMIKVVLSELSSRLTEGLLIIKLTEVDDI